MASTQFPSFRAAPVQSVQELIKKPIPAVPQPFILDDPQSPILSASTPLPLLPTINMKHLIMSETADSELEKLHSTCKEWGFFQLVNHGVSSSLVEKLKSEIGEFYKLPLEERIKYKMRPGDFEGYGLSPIRSEDQKLDWGDRFYMTTNPIHTRKPYLLPELPPSLRDSLECYLAELQKLAMMLLGFMAKALKLEKGEMEELFEDGKQSVRMTYYPPCPQPELVMGLTPHSDATGITILLQINGVDGLQIKNDGVWIPVSFLPDALVVNIGDILEVSPHGVYTSIEHRATVNAAKERISIAMFFNPKSSAHIKPATSLTNPHNPSLFKQVSMEKYVKDFFSRKLDGKWYIEHLKIKNEEEYRTLPPDDTWRASLSGAALSLRGSQGRKASPLASSVGTSLIQSQVKMSTPSSSRLSTRGEEDNTEWRRAIERRQLVSKRQMQALLQEIKRLREENAVLRIQASSMGSPHDQRSRG
eukprot:XP_002270646.2 PREDICTED: protein SRG1 [Vitis vinifera]